MYAFVYPIFIITSIFYFNTEGRNVIKENISNSLDGYLNPKDIRDVSINKFAVYGPFFPVYCNCSPGICIFDIGLQRNVCRCPVGWYRVTSWMSSECKNCNCGEGVGCRLEGFFDPTVQCLCSDGYSSIDSKCKATCEINPCLNHGTCKVTADNSVECVCEPEFSGDFCEIKGCGENICQNGGTCRVLENVKYCQCLNGTKGDHCEKVDGCDKLRCGENSLCSLNITTGKPFCACTAEGFNYDARDKICKENCVNKACQNGGICESVGASKFCLCMAGTFGDHCDIVSVCTGFHCGADAKCQFDVLTGNPFCKCKEETLNYDARDKKCKRSCYKKKCQNGGSCVFSGNFKFCQCKNGTSGDLCETLVHVNAMALTIGNENGILDHLYDKHNRPVENSSEAERILKIHSNEPIAEPNCKCKYGYCETDTNGTTLCKCPPEWSLNTWDSCKKCDCGKDANCTFKDQFFTHSKQCICKEGYSDVDGTCIGSCSNNTCKNGGTCNVKGNDIMCTCKPPFSGEYCQIRTCSDNPCKNGGTCNIKGNDVVCTCKYPFSGRFCEIPRCDCKYGYCETDENGEPICKCHPEWGLFTWTSCKKCDCGEGANCTFKLWFFYHTKYCVCKEGYTDVDGTCKGSCSNNPCKNGGTCNLKGNDIVCTCTPPFSGEYCEIKTHDGCTPHFCQNDGICKLVNNSKTCQCLAGTRGDRCELVDGCNTLSCGAESICTFNSTTGKPFCACKSGLRYDPRDRTCKESCDEKNCQNGGICETAGDSKFCLCMAGIFGDLCDIVSVCKGFNCGEDAECQFDIVTGNPFCKCKDKSLHYDPAIRKCKRSCYREKCQNEGICAFSGNFKFCQCKKGTSGDFCEIGDSLPSQLRF